MTFILNEYEVDDAVRRFNATDTPNLKLAADRLKRLVDWTNRNSDGWPYWGGPSNASTRLQELIHKAGRIDPVDISPADLAAACRPIKAFLTKQGVDHGVVFADPVTPAPSELFQRGYEEQTEWLDRVAPTHLDPMSFAAGCLSARQATAQDLDYNEGGTAATLDWIERNNS